jgi:hypothetical protein
MLEHSEMKKMKAKHADWIWNRSDTHVILGVPGSLDAFKTIIEPGNSFSPGPGSYGISNWIFVNDKLHAPEEKCIDDLKWNYHEGYIPVLRSEWTADQIMLSSELFTDGDYALSNYQVYFSIDVSNMSTAPVNLSFYLVIRSFGASGGPIKQLSHRNGTVYINKEPLLYLDKNPTCFGALSYSATGDDISISLRKGILPLASDVKDESGWASGAVEYKISLNANESNHYDFVFHMHRDHWMLQNLPEITRPLNVGAKKRSVIDYWKNLFSIVLDLPDKRFQEAFYVQLAHLYMFTVHHSPRISPVSYPLFWLRDGVYIAIALDKGGFHDFARNACKLLASGDAFGGFGSEGDGPSDGIWAITEHYLLTRDQNFLREMYPHLERKAGLLIKMIHTDRPIKHFTEFSIPKCMLDPNSDMMCLASEEGLIKGKMDHHFPDLWINAFAFLALSRISICAKELSLDSTEYENEAENLKKSLMKKARLVFGQNDRDYNSAYWPTGWASLKDSFILDHYKNFWNRTRCPDGKHNPEPLWTYFEAGQAHNYLILGMREQAWVSISYFLTHHTAPGLYTYHEGCDDENSSLLWQRTRGWDQIQYVTPHGWTAAEVFLLLRDCLAREENDVLIIGSGLPLAWMDRDFHVKDFPTHFGKISYSYEASSQSMVIKIEKVPAGGIVIDTPVPVTCKIIAEFV